MVLTNRKQKVVCKREFVIRILHKVVILKYFQLKNFKLTSNCFRTSQNLSQNKKKVKPMVTTGPTLKKATKAVTLMTMVT